MKLAVVYNSRSGSALSRHELDAAFAEANITVATFIDITKSSPASLKRLASRYSTIAAYGGDGTICSVADAVAGTRTTLAPLPGGTLNHFTKDLGIPQDLSEAIRRLSSAKAKDIDIAEVNGKAFVNNSSIGFYPSSLRERSRLEKHLGKWPAAVFASIRSFVKFQIYELSLDNKTIRTPFVFIGNNVYDSSDGMARHHVNKGVLSVYAVRSTKRRTLFKLLALALVNRVDDADELQSFTTKELRVTTRRSRLRVATDGEHELMKPPLRYVSRAGALKVL